jgi:hypothetical protein
MASGRDEWQNFKKKHPGFEKLKGYKGNFGPQLEQTEKALEQYKKLWLQYLSKLEEAQKTGLELLNYLPSVTGPAILAKTAMDEYEKLVHGSTDQGMKTDFQRHRYEVFPFSGGYYTMENVLTSWTRDFQKQQLEQRAANKLKW